MQVHNVGLLPPLLTGSDAEKKFNLLYNKERVATGKMTDLYMYHFNRLPDSRECRVATDKSGHANGRFIN